MTRENVTSNITVNPQRMVSRQTFLPGFFSDKKKPESKDIIKTVQKDITRLITIKGILFSSEARLSHVIIEINNQQVNYQSGMSLPMFDGVSIKKINKKSIIVSTPNGDNEFFLPIPTY